MNKILESVNLTYSYSLNFLTRPTVGLNHLNQSYKKNNFRTWVSKLNIFLKYIFSSDLTLYSVVGL